MPSFLFVVYNTSDIGGMSIEISRTYIKDIAEDERARQSVAADVAAKEEAVQTGSQAEREGNERRLHNIQVRMGQLKQAKRNFLERTVGLYALTSAERLRLHRAEGEWERTEEGKEYLALYKERNRLKDESRQTMVDLRPPQPEATEHEKRERDFRHDVQNDVDKKLARLQRAYLDILRDWGQDLAKINVAVLPPEKRRQLSRDVSHVGDIFKEREFLEKVKRDPLAMPPAELMAYYARKQGEAFGAEKEAARMLAERRQQWQEHDSPRMHRYTQTERHVSSALHASSEPQTEKQADSVRAKAFEAAGVSDIAADIEPYQSAVSRATRIKNENSTILQKMQERA